MNEFVLERTLLEKFDEIQKALSYCKVDVSRQVEKKSKNQNIQIPQDLKNRMSKDVESCQQKKFYCPNCPKHFDDGRKLGGHISRAHPGQKKLAIFKRKLSGIKRSNKNTNIKLEPGMEEKDFEQQPQDQQEEEESQDDESEANDSDQQISFSKKRMISKARGSKSRIPNKRVSRDNEGESRVSKQSSKSGKSKKEKKEKKRQGNENVMEDEESRKKNREQIYDDEDQ